jgi:tetratricopeptide (TPR) repeat protein
LRLFTRCVALNVLSQEGIGQLAKKLLNIVLNSRDLKNQFGKLVREFDPLLAPQPQARDIVTALKSDSLDKILQALITARQQIDHEETCKPELVQALIGLVYKQNWPAKCSTDIYYEETHKILGDLGGKARVLPAFRKLKATKSPAFTLKVVIDTGHPKGPTVLYLDQVMKRLVKGLERRINTDKKDKFVQSAWALTKFTLLQIFALAPVKQSSVERKLRELVSGGTWEAMEMEPVVSNPGLDSAVKYSLTAFFTLQIASDHPEMTEFAQNVIVRFAILLFLKHEGCSYEPLPFNPDVLLDVMSSLMAYKEAPGDRTLPTLLKTLETLLWALRELVNGNEAMLVSSKTLSKILQTLVIACHRPEPQLQLGACMILISSLEKFPTALVRAEALSLLKASLFVLETLPSQTRSKNLDYPKNLLRELQKYLDLHIIVAHYCAALISSSSTLRDLARKLLLELAGGEANLSAFLGQIMYPIPCAYGQLCDSSLSQQLARFVLDSPTHEPLARVIVLENFHFFIKTKIIDLEQEAQREKIMALVTSVISLIPKNDGPEEGDTGDIANRGNKSELSIDEKIACFEAMSAVLRFRQMWDESVEGTRLQYTEHRNNIIFRLLRAMTESDPHILAIAKEGIKLVLQNIDARGNILPHDDLKKCLRPILLVIANPNRVPTLEYLTNFSGLLELIANCFNKHLGERLCKHLEEISRRVAAKDIPLIYRIVSLFHLMPDCVLEVQDKVLHACLECEGQMKKANLQGYIAATVRDPLVKFLSRFKDRSLPNFFTNFQPGNENCQYIISLLKLPSACVLRDYVTSTFHVNNGRRIYDVLLEQSRFEGLRLINTLCKFMPRWFSTQTLILYQILEIWSKVEKNENSTETKLINDCYEEKYIFKILISFARYNHKEAINLVLFTLPLGFARKRMINVSFLSEFLQQELPTIYTPDEKRKIMKKVVEALEGSDRVKLDNDHCSKIIEHLVLPMLEESFKQGQGELVLKKKMYYRFIPLWKQLTNQYHNPLCAQLMNLGTLLIKYFKNEFYHYRKELIKFGWNMIKSENPLIKSSAFVNVAYFIQEYGVPEVLIIHFIRNMLGFQSSDHFPAIQKAFGHLSKRIEGLILEYQYKEKFMEFVRQQLFRNQQPQTLLNVFELIIKNEEIFYHFRESMIQQFMHWINTVGMNIHSEYPAKKTLLDLNHLIIRWADRRKKEGMDDFLNVTNKALIINTLARLGQAPAFYVKTTGRNFEQVNALSLKCYPILNSGLSIWKDVSFKSEQWVESMKRCEQLTDTQQRNNIDAKRRLVERCLNIIKTVAMYHTRDDIVGCPELFIHLADLVKTLEYPLLLNLLCDILRLLLQGQADQLIFQLQKKIEQCLGETQPANYTWVVKLLGVICESHHRVVLQFLPSLAKVVMHIAKQLSEDPRKAVDNNETLIGALYILKENIYDIRENLKKSMCQSLALIFEFAQDMKVVQQACSLFEIWIETDVAEIQLSTWEQCSLLCKLFNPARDMEPTASMFDLAFRVVNSQIPPCEAKTSLTKALLAYITKYNLSDFRKDLDRLMTDTIGNIVFKRLLFILDQPDFPLNPQWSKISCDVLLASLSQGKVTLRVQDSLNSTDVNMFLSAHSQYMREQAETSSAPLTQSLREVAMGGMADDLVVQLFREHWKQMEKDQKEHLSFFVEKMLKDSRLLQDPTLSNPVRTLLLAVLCCADSQPAVTPALTQFVAKAYNCWDLAIPMLEAASNRGDQEALLHLEGLYQRLEEPGYEYGCTLQRATNPSQRAGIHLLLQGCNAEAKAEFEKHLSVHSDDETALISKSLWEQATRSLADWSTLAEYGEAGNFQAALDACFQQEPTHKFQEMLATAGLETHPLSAYYLKFSHLPASLQETGDSRKPKDTLIFTLFKGVPKYLSPVHLPLLQHISLQREFTEGQTLNANVMNFLGGRRQTHDAEAIISVWKERKILASDPPSFWLTLLRTRAAVLEQIGKTLAGHQKTAQEDGLLFSPLWVHLKKAELARKQGLIMVAGKILAGVQSELEKVDAAKAAAERVHFYVEATKLSMAAGDLELAYTLASEAAAVLPDDQKGKAHYLRARVTERMGLTKEAYAHYGEAAQLPDARGKVWLRWAGLIESGLSTQSTPELVQNALICYFRGLSGVSDQQKLYVPRVIALLEREDAQQFASVSFSKEVDQVPASVWAPWVHQLLTILLRGTLPDMLSVLLQRIAQQFPQLLYYHVSARLSSTEKPAPLLELLEELNNRFPLLKQAMDVLRIELCEQFRMSSEEDLCSALTVLIHRFDPTQAGFRSDLKEALGEVHERFFLSGKDQTYKEWFEKELGIEHIATLPAKELYLRIRRVRDAIAPLLSQKAAVCNIEHRSPLLTSLRYAELLVPGTEVPIDRILPTYSAIPARNYNKRIGFRGVDAKVYSFALAITRPGAMYSYRLQQVLSILNDLFKASGRINTLGFALQRVVPLNANMRLIECPEDETTLQEMYESALRLHGLAIDAPLLAWLEALDQGVSSPEASAQALVPPSLFMNYLQLCLRTPERYFLYRKQFTVQWSLNLFLSQLLGFSMTSQLTSSVWLNRSAGTFSYGFWTEPSLPEGPEGPRLSANIKFLIGPAGLNGLVPQVCSAAADVLIRKRSVLLPALRLILRDEESVKIDQGFQRAEALRSPEAVQTILTQALQTRQPLSWTPWF